MTMTMARRGRVDAFARLVFYCLGRLKSRSCPNYGMAKSKLSVAGGGGGGRDPDAGGGGGVLGYLVIAALVGAVVYIYYRTLQLEKEMRIAKETQAGTIEKLFQTHLEKAINSALEEAAATAAAIGGEGEDACSHDDDEDCDVKRISTSKRVNDSSHRQKEASFPVHTVPNVPRPENKTPQPPPQDVRKQQPRPPQAVPANVKDEDATLTKRNVQVESASSHADDPVKPAPLHADDPVDPAPSQTDDPVEPDPVVAVQSIHEDSATGTEAIPSDDNSPRHVESGHILQHQMLVESIPSAHMVLVLETSGGEGDPGVSAVHGSLTAALHALEMRQMPPPAPAGGGMTIQEISEEEDA